jgi:hypothetical protein
MENKGVPEAMMSAWVDSGELDIPDRLLAALVGAESKGGDIRVGSRQRFLFLTPIRLRLIRSSIFGSTIIRIPWSSLLVS